MRPSADAGKPIDDAVEPIAVISMAGRFPGASNVEEFWVNLCSGVESIARFSRQGSDPHFVGAEGVVEGYDRFDAEFFGYSPREAQILDPQHRLCLEAAWNAFDTAGYDPQRIGVPVGVYLSASMSSYLIRNLLPNKALLELLGGFAILTHNDKDFLASTVSYKLGLTGPSMAVGTACSSSLVAVHLAVQSLRAGECDLALAGGVSLQVPAPQGYVYRDDGIYSPDGHCRPFGAGARGTVGGSGVGVVLLKRWGDARRDHDHVHALVLGSAVNNDGAAKIGYTAPGVDGQTAVIAEAQAVAGITAERIGYVEAHGTGTRLGDAIEMQALTRAFRQTTQRMQSCAVGAVKGNIGHLDAAAGIAGFIKTVLAVRHATIPASLYCDPPNEQLGLSGTPFKLNSATIPWLEDGRPRVAGVSAFGIGGSNAHVILGQAPAAAPAPARTRETMLLSARNESTLDQMSADLTEYLRAGSPNPAGVAATLAGRRHHRHRLAMLLGGDGGPQIVRSVATETGRPVVFAFCREEYALAQELIRRGVRPAVVLGHGPGEHAAAAIARLQPDVRQVRSQNRLEEALGEVLGLANATLIEIGSSSMVESAAGHPRLRQGHLLLAIENDDELDACVARLWAEGVEVAFPQREGVQRVPVPEYPLQRKRFWVDPPGELDLRGIIAALEPEAVAEDDSTTRAMAEVDRLCAALALDYLRASTIDTLPGARYELTDLFARLGVLPAFRRFVEYMLSILDKDGVVTLDAGVVVFNSHTLEDAAAVTERLVERHPAQRGLVDLLNHCAASYPGALTTPGVALSVLYPQGRGDLLAGFLGTQKGDQIDAMMSALCRAADRLAANRSRPLRVLEVGAGGGRLTWQLGETLAGRADYLATDIGPLFLDHLRDEAASRGQSIRTGLLDISRDPVQQSHQRASFDLIVGLDVVHATRDVRASLQNLTTLLAPGGLLGIIETTAQHRWLSMIWGLSEGWWQFGDGLRNTTPLLDHEGWRKAVAGLGSRDWAVLPASGSGAALILAQAAVAVADDGVPIRLPDKEPDLASWCYLPGWRRVGRPVEIRTARHCVVFASGPIGDAVVERLRGRDVKVTVMRPGDRVELEQADVIAQLWAVDGFEHNDQDFGLHASLELARALGARSGNAPVRLVLATRGAQDVTGGDLTRPAQATAHAAAKVIPREYPAVTCVAVDIDGDTFQGEAADQLILELLGDSPDSMVAYRHGRRWVPTVEPLPLPEVAGAVSNLRPGGVYLVCGGLGGVGLGLAEHLATLPATVILTGRSEFAPPDEWERLAADPNRTDSEVAQRLLAMRSAGATVVVERADIADAAAMRDVVERAVSRFGPIAGVIHAAGVPDVAGMIQRRTRADTDAVLSAKLAGTLSLAAALHDQRPDFVMLCSSIGTVLHKLKFGEVGYVAGHEFLQAFAAHRWGGSRSVIAVAWTDWLEGGMWARAQQRLAERYVIGDNASVRPDSDLLRGITTAEGVEIFRRVLAHRPGPVVIVSTQRMDRLLAIHDAYTTAAHTQLVGQLSAAGDGQRRSDLDTDFAPPGTATQRAIAGIWSELLGVNDIGIDDDFFLAGGDSLIALRMLSRVRDETGVDHPISAFFAEPTVRALADVAEAQSAPRPAVSASGDHEEVLI